MYIRASSERIINAALVTEVEDIPAADASEERALMVYMAGGRTIALGAGEADRFLAALPVYEPTSE